MFTGLTAAMGVMASVDAVADGEGRRFVIRAPFALGDVAVGDSVACAGVCLTAVEIRTGDDDDIAFAVVASPETLALTTLGDLGVGDRLNLELSLRLGDRLGGHLVSGHVDGIGEIVAVEPQGAARRVVLRTPSALVPLIAVKGSLAIDGVSMTVNAVGRDAEGGRVEVAVIPHTWEVTTFSEAIPGRRVNLEVDLIARYVAQLMKDRREGSEGDADPQAFGG